MKLTMSITVMLFSLSLMLVETRNIKTKDANGKGGGEEKNEGEEKEGGTTLEDKDRPIKEGAQNIVVVGCGGNACAPRSNCSVSEGSRVHDTGLTYMCRCPRQIFGIFCTIPRELACHNCLGPGFYCLPTNMHWSGRFCYDTITWERLIDGNCGRWKFSCDGGTLCVAPSSLCDGFSDCEDGTDESGLHCPNSIEGSSGLGEDEN